MDYIRNFYTSFKLIINPKPPLKTNYYCNKTNHLIKNAKYLPIFKDDFGNFYPKKYNGIKISKKINEEELM